MAWIDYKKAYDMVPHSWILKNFRSKGIDETIRITVRKQCMKKWSVELTCGSESLQECLKRGIFQGDSTPFCCMFNPTYLRVEEMRSLAMGVRSIIAFQMI